MSSDELRAGLHGMWSSVATNWGEHAAYVDARSASVTERMLELSAPRPGERVLELACGPGGAGLVAAARVAPGGEVVLSDVAPEMTAIALGRARALGLANVSTLELDLERVDQPGASYDVVLCREGLMLVLEPSRAAGEIHRLLRPGGRAAVAVWGPQERNPWLGALFDAVSAQIGGPVPPPGIPGPFSLADRDELAAVLSGAGLAQVELAEVADPVRLSSFEEWWSVVPALAGPLANMLAVQPKEVVDAIRAHARDRLAEYEGPAGLEIPGLALVAAGRQA